MGNGSKCIICNSTTEELTSDFLSSTKTTKHEFHRHLYVIFILRNILELPVHQLANHLKNNWDVQNWISLCGRCDELVIKCREIYDQLLQISKRFKSCQLSIINIVKESECGLGESYDPKKTRNFVEQARDFVSEYDYEHLIDPMEKMRSWACRTEVKKELADPTEEDGITNTFIKTELESEDDDDDVPSPAVADEVPEDPLFSGDDDYGLSDREEKDGWELDANDCNSTSVGKHFKEPEPVCPNIQDGNDQFKNLKTDNETGIRECPSSRPNMKKRDQLAGEKVFVCPLCKLYKNAITYEKSFFICIHLDKCSRTLSLKKKVNPNQISQLKCTLCSYSCPLSDVSKYVSHLVSCSKRPSSTPLRYRIFHCSICAADTQSTPFFTIDDFIRHHCYHAALTYKCTECSHLFSSAEKAVCCRSHWKTSHRDLLSSAVETSDMYTKLETPICPEVPWWCSKCGELFNGETERNVHYQSMHPLNSFEQGEQIKCQFCDQLYHCSEELKLHLGTAHMLETNRLLQCDQCSDVFLEKSHAVSHCLRHHNKIKTSRKKLLKRRFREHATPPGIGKKPKYPCTSCGTDFRTKEEFHGHQRRHHQDEKKEHQCDECPYSSNSNWHLKRHKKSRHQPNERVSKTRMRSECNICQQVCRGPKALVRHTMRMHATDNEVKDEEGGTPNVLKASRSTPKVYNRKVEECSKSRRKRKVRRGATEGAIVPRVPKKKKECRDNEATVECNSSAVAPLTQSGDDNRTHHNPVDDAPKIADKSSVGTSKKRTKPKRKKYRKLVTETSKCICETCGKVFARETTLRVHRYVSLRCKRLHMSEEEATVMCEICGNRYSSKYTLKVHILQTHEGNYKATCPDCGRKFDSVARLNRHMAAFAQGESCKNTLYKCLVEGCDMTFPSSQRRRSHHQEQHKGIPMQFKCGQCGKAFSCPKYLCQHARLVHTGVTYYGKKKKKPLEPKSETKRI